ncbi:hypothetical protein O6H91_20G059700 [Diphasiastrum complanatum]|uniref:Uncharacterized protein n=3 Tax=Diphasiastrum complanatum TaxID=34168 RepID=A0ACC2AQR8_DIPCM|nr:hypothetical protein O6H91_20G059700 [Diphasiastrum complanatum]
MGGCVSCESSDGNRLLALSPKEVAAVWEALSASQKEGSSSPFEENNLDWLYLQNPNGVTLRNSEQSGALVPEQEFGSTAGFTVDCVNENWRSIRKASIESTEFLPEEQERRLRCANLELRPGLELGWSSDEEEGFLFARNSNLRTSRRAVDSDNYVMGDKRPNVWDQHMPVRAIDACQGHNSTNRPSSSSQSLATKTENLIVGSSPCVQPMQDILSGHEMLCGSLSRQMLDYPESPYQLALLDSQNSCSQSRSSSAYVLSKDREVDTLIPGLPIDLAQLCLMRVPFIKYEPKYKLVSRRWRAVLSSTEFYTTRKALGIGETYICFAVHGSRLQLFNLQTHSWFCLPPLPREEALYSPGFHIDPYDWWQIDTVAVCDGTLFVLGGDQADLFSLIPCSKPSDQVHKYDYCKNRWEKAMSMGVSRSHSAAISCGKHIYVAGGRAEVYEGASAEVYDFEKGAWSPIPRMNTAMRICVGMEHDGKLYVKGENAGPGCPIEGEVFDPIGKTWERMMPGLKSGLARGPAASASSCVFVADWKDSLLKRYIFELDCWEVVGDLPARFSRLVGHLETLYGFTGKIKVDPYSHRLISDSPAEVWKTNMSLISDRVNESCSSTPSIEMLGLENQNSCLETARCLHSSKWVCVWREPKQTTKIGGFTWVPCSAHFALLQD